MFNALYGYFTEHGKCMVSAGTGVFTLHTWLVCSSLKEPFLI